MKILAMALRSVPPYLEAFPEKQSKAFLSDIFLAKAGFNHPGIEL
jgi:hypothetical protein